MGMYRKLLKSYDWLTCARALRPLSRTHRTWKCSYQLLLYIWYTASS